MFLSAPSCFGTKSLCFRTKHPCFSTKQDERGLKQDEREGKQRDRPPRLNQHGLNPNETAPDPVNRLRVIDETFANGQQCDDRFDLGLGVD